MSQIYLKPVEYPKEIVLEFEELSEEGREEMIRKAKEIIEVLS